jgi:serine/threonine protein kinase
LTKNVGRGGKTLITIGYDLLEQIFELDYQKRITAAEALKHPYLSDLHNPDDEVSKILLHKY